MLLREVWKFHVAKRVIGDMPDASADEPYSVFYAGRDVSAEARVSPVDVAAIAFEDEPPQGLTVVA